MMTFAQVHTLSLVVCADKSHTLQEVKAFAECEHPSGTSMGWCNSFNEHETPKGKVKSPCFCDVDENKQHWILTV